MKAKYQSGTSFCIEIFDRTSSTCMTVAEAVRLKEELTKAIDDAEIDKKKELTEFELRLLDWLSTDTSGEVPMERMKEIVKNRAAILLELAKKELLKDDELAKKHLDGYCMGREDTMREMMDFIKSHFNCEKAREGTYYKDYERSTEPIPSGIPYQSPQCGTNVAIVPNINSGTSTLKEDE